MNNSDERFKKAVERLGGEAFWLNTYHTAICGLTVDAIGLDFFRVSLNALQDARLMRLIRVLDRDSKSASFWYLWKSNEKLLSRIAKETGFDLDLATKLSDRLKGIRTKTMMHLDKDGILDTKKVYDEAAITHDEIDSFISLFWELMLAVNLNVFGNEIKFDVYSGKDIVKLAALRDEAIENGLEGLFKSGE